MKPPGSAASSGPKQNFNSSLLSSWVNSTCTTNSRVLSDPRCSKKIDKTITTKLLSLTLTNGEKPTINCWFWPRDWRHWDGWVGSPAGVVNVQKGGKRNTSALPSCSPSGLQGLAGGGGAGEDALNGTSVEEAHDGGQGSCSPQLLQKVESLLMLGVLSPSSSPHPGGDRCHCTTASSCSLFSLSESSS